MTFKSPSEHSVGSDNSFFPLEVQLHLISGDFVRLNIAFLFSFDEKDNDFLKKLGFGRGVLAHL